MDFKDFGNAKVIVGGRAYPARTVEYEQTYGEYPCVQIEAVLNPFLASTSPVKTSDKPTITNVIFNPPATIVFWSDNTKTVVKCDWQWEPYDPEKGLAMAISKKLLGNNKYEYYHTFLHWLKKYDKQEEKMNSLSKTPTPTDEYNPTEMYR